MLPLIKLDFCEVKFLCLLRTNYKNKNLHIFIILSKKMPQNVYIHSVDSTSILYQNVSLNEMSFDNIVFYLIQNIEHSAFCFIE